MRRIFLLAASLVLLSQPASAFTQLELEAQLQRLMDWWPGEYDNNEQIVRQSGGGLAKPVYAPFFRIYSHYVVLDQPDLGDHVLYVEQYLDNDPANVARIHVYTLEVDEQAQAIRATPHVFRDGQQSMVGAHMDPKRLAEIGADKLRALSAGCAVFIRFEGAQFRGGTNDESCGEEGWFDDEFVVGPGHYWFRDRQEDSEPGELASGQGPGVNFAFLQSTKARRFVCSVAYNLDGDMTRTEFLTEIELHDQGGAADIDWPDGRTLEFIIHTREFAAPSERVFPLYRIHEKGNHVPIAYAYAVDNADRFGLNLGWFYILCREKDQGVPDA